MSYAMAEDKVSSPQQLDWSGKTIFIIENDNLSVLLLAEYFSNTNARLIQAPNHEALISTENGHVDLIIKGITLTEFKNSLSLTKKIRLQYPGIPIIAHSASVYEQDIQACLKAGCDGFVPKPLDFDYLTTVLIKFLGNKDLI